MTPGRGRRPGAGGPGGPARRPREPDPDALREPEPDADPVDVARTICLRLLEQQPRTRAQLAAALRKRGVPDEVGAEVLDRFTEVGLVDDQAFAATWVSSRHAGRRLARRALAAELRRRGVDPAVARSAVEQVSPEDARAAARGLVERRVRASARLPREVLTRRLVAMLARKGYPPEVAFGAVRDVLDADVAGPPAGGCGAADPDAWAGADPA